MEAIIALESMLASRFNDNTLRTYKIPNPSNVTSPSFARSFKLRFQNMHVEKVAKYRSVAELKANQKGL